MDTVDPIKIPCGVKTVNVEFNETECWTPPETVAWNFEAAPNMELNGTVAGYIAKTTTLVMEKMGVAGDAISPAAGTYTYSCGDEVELLATPAEGSAFVQWIGNGVLDPALTKTKVFMTQDTTVQGVFTRAIFSLSMAASGEGTVSPDTGIYGYENGQEVRISATPNAADGWIFSRWVVLML
jgi:hypothetical protein